MNIWSTLPVSTGLLCLTMASTFTWAADSGPNTALNSTGQPGKSRLAPVAMAAAADGKTLYVAGASARSVLVFDPSSRKLLRSLDLPGSPSGLVLAADGASLVVTCAGPESQVCVLNLATGEISATIPTGHTAMSPVLAPNGQTLYVCNRFNDCVAVIDLASRRETARIPVAREPVAAALTRDGRFLLVANHLPDGKSDADVVAASVSVIDVAKAQVTRTLALPNGSTLLRDVRISPDGKYACVTHGLARFHMPTTQLERGWMNTSAVTLIDLATWKVINTVLVDNVDSGAANPWAAAWSSDGKTLCVTHAGTHELSVINAAGLLEKLAKMPESPSEANAPDYTSASRSAADVPNDLSFLVGLRQRLQLTGNGPRALLLLGHQAWVADYFSDTLEMVDLEARPAHPVAVSLGSGSELSVLDRGERLFNDARICFQGWQSCATCHSEEARVDGLNWDLLNDGLGNPKNTKSMLWSHRTPPAMSMGVRETAETAVRAGIRHILFTVQPEDVALAMDEYLKALKPLPSPYLVRGQLSEAARRGKMLFQDSAVGCASCHPPGLYTDLQHHNVGTKGRFDREVVEFDTPTLVEIWRTAPYLHDGSALTIKDVITTANQNNRHGQTSHLTADQIRDLVEYLRSL